MPNTAEINASETDTVIAAGLPHPNAQYALATAQEEWVKAKNALHLAGEALERAEDTLAHAKNMFNGRQPVVAGILQPTDFEPHVAHLANRAPLDAADASAEGAGQDGNALRASAALLAANPVFVNADEVRQQATEADPTGDKARGGGEATTGAATEAEATGG